MLKPLSRIRRHPPAPGELTHAVGRALELGAADAVRISMVSWGIDCLNDRESIFAVVVIGNGEDGSVPSRRANPGWETWSIAGRER